MTELEKECIHLWLLDAHDYNSEVYTEIKDRNYHLLDISIEYELDDMQSINDYSRIITATHRKRITFNIRIPTYDILYNITDISELEFNKYITQAKISLFLNH